MFSFMGTTVIKKKHILWPIQSEDFTFSLGLCRCSEKTLPPSSLPNPPNLTSYISVELSSEGVLLSLENGGGRFWTFLQLSSLQTASSTTDSTCPLGWNFSLCSVSPAFHFREVWWENIPLTFCWYFFPIFGSCTVPKFLDLFNRKKKKHKKTKL